MRQQRNMFKTKEQDKTSEEELSGDRKSTWERVQGNDCKDNKRTLDKNGWTEKLEVFNKKNNQTDEEYNNWNEKYTKRN